MTMKNKLTHLYEILFMGAVFLSPLIVVKIWTWFYSMGW